MARRILPYYYGGGKNKKDIDDKKNSDIVEKNLQKSINNSNFIFSIEIRQIIKRYGERTRDKL